MLEFSFSENEKVKFFNLILKLEQKSNFSTKNYAVWFGWGGKLNR